MGYVAAEVTSLGSIELRKRGGNVWQTSFSTLILLLHTILRLSTV